MPVLAALVLRVNAALLFMSIAVGALLEQTLGDSTAFTLTTLVHIAHNDEVARIGLLALPIVLTLLFLRKTAKRRDMLLQLLPLLLCGAALAAIVLPLLTPGIRGAVAISRYSLVIDQSQDLVVAAAAAINMMLAWRSFRHREESHRSKKH